MRLLPIFLLSACVPSLTTPDHLNRNVDWSCPDNTWPASTPTESMMDSRSLEGFYKGDLLPDGTLTDQHGDPVCLWQFTGKPVLVDISPGWCEPCKKLACYARDLADDFADQDLVYLTVMPEAEARSRDVEVRDAVWWADKFELDTPVLIDPKGAYSYNANDGQFPAILLIDESMIVRDRFVAKSDAHIRQRLESALGLVDPGNEHVSVCEE